MRGKHSPPIIMTGVMQPRKCHSIQIWREEERRKRNSKSFLSIMTCHDNWPLPLMVSLEKLGVNWLVVWTLECSGPLSAQQTEWCDDLSLDTRRRRGERSHQWKLVPLLILRNYAQWDPSWAPGSHVYTIVDRVGCCHGCWSLKLAESENRLSWALELPQPDEGLGNFLSPGPRLSTIRVFPQRIWLDNWRRT